MPIFEYKCHECGQKFEELVRSSEEKVVCPECGSASPSKLLSTFAASSSGQPSLGGGCGGSGFS